MTNFKANYERFFGKIETKEEFEIQPLTESEKTKFTNLSQILARKYPNAPLTIKDGYVWAGSKKIEEASKFIGKSSLTIQEQIRTISNSGKKGLI